MTVLAHVDWIKVVIGWFVIAFLLLVAWALFVDGARWLQRRRRRRAQARFDRARDTLGRERP